MSFSGKIAHGFVLVLSVLLLLITSSPIQASTVEFLAIDLTDTTPGEDLWRYDYTVTGSFQQAWFFDVLFDASLYRTLKDPSAPNLDWDAIILQQPNPGELPPFDRGIFDAFALINNPSLSGSFSVSFIYLGPGTPGSQMFEVFDAGANSVETGLTSPLAGEVPEPATAALVGFGLIACAILYRRKIEIRRRT